MIRYEDVEAIQRRLRAREVLGPEGGWPRSLAGLLRCSGCGSYLVARSVRGGLRYYRCRNATLGISGVVPCGEKSIRADALEYVVQLIVSGQELDDEAAGGPVGGTS